MIIPIQERVRRHVEALVQRLYRLDDPPPIVIDYPPSRSLGDLALPVAFELARRLRKPPKVIAGELAERFGPPPPGVRSVQVAAGGYLNLYLDRPSFLRERLIARAGESSSSRNGKVIVEHTAINPNKAAHIGHLRNAALGDTLVRLLRFQQVPVEVQNYIDDTGVQVADVVVGFQEIEGVDLQAIGKIAETTQFDYYCWDLYARVTSWYEEDRRRLQARSRALHRIEQGGNETAEIAAFVAERIVRLHLATMARLDVRYDLLTWEGDILRLRFWDRAFEILKASGAIFRQSEGKLAGCWVMRIKDEGNAAEADSDGSDEEGDAREKVIVRSDGTVTYVGKDIAYQYWKLGLLDRDFHYRVYDRLSDGHILWATSSAPASIPAVPVFGRAETTYNVIDVRQSYLQKLLKQTLTTLGHFKEAEHSVHFSYEMVALSPETARTLGYAATDLETGRPFVEVSGRKGQGVKADDLLDALFEKARREIIARNPELAPDEQAVGAQQIACAAVRYFMLKYSRSRVIAFDLDEALNFEGESGPYLQYAVVRAVNIFAKLREREGIGEYEILDALEKCPETTLEAEGDELWALVLESARLDEVVAQVIRSLEFSVLAKYALSLAQMFNAFYHKYQILREERPDVRIWRAAAVMYFQRQLTRTLGLMGLSVPARM